MAKDPAFLFYPADWHLGTMTLTRHQKGCYIDLLMAQFNNGPLSLDTIKVLLGQDQAVWTVLRVKFKQTADGLWYNERLATEKQKRESFCKSRRDIRNSHTLKHKTTHTSQRMENRNKNENLNNSGGGMGEPMTAAEMFDPKLSENKFKEYSSMQIWLESVSKNQQIPMKSLLEKLKKFFSDANDKGWLPGQPDKEIRSYFVNWIIAEKKKKNFTFPETVKTNYQKL